MRLVFDDREPAFRYGPRGRPLDVQRCHAISYMAEATHEGLTRAHVKMS